MKSFSSAQQKPFEHVCSCFEEARWDTRLFKNVSSIFQIIYAAYLSEQNYI